MSYFATFYRLVRDIIFICLNDSKQIVMATESGFVMLEDLKRQAEVIGFEGKEKTKCFVDEKDNNLDSYLLRFERYATVAGWERSDWATCLYPLLSGRALDVYSGLSDEQARDYDKLQKALLQRYDFTEQSYRERFRGAKPEGQESPS